MRRHPQAYRVRQRMTLADIDACDRADRIRDRLLMVLIILQALVIAWGVVQILMGGA